jgi:hypothetical protein
MLTSVRILSQATEWIPSALSSVIRSPFATVLDVLWGAFLKSNPEAEMSEIIRLSSETIKFPVKIK